MIYPYYSNNSNIYMIIFYISIIYIFVCLFLYLNLLYYSYNNKKLSEFIHRANILKILTKLLYSAFTFWFIEVFCGMIFCCTDHYSFYMKNFKCWEKTHIIYFIFSIISMILLNYICYVFLVYSNEKINDKHVILSKYLINNAKLNLFFFKLIQLSLAYISELKNIDDFNIVIFFIISIINLRNFYMETQYDSKKSFTNKIFYHCSFINFYSFFLLFLGMIIKKTKFKGLIYVFIILLIIHFSSLPFYKTSNFKVNKQLFSYNKDYEIFNQLRLIIESFNDLNLSRKDMINLISFSVDKINTEKLNVNLRMGISDSEFKYIFFDYIEEIFKMMINRFKQSIILKIYYVIFLINVIHKQNKAYLYLYQIYYENQETLSYSELFLIYRIKKNIEDKNIENILNKSEISFKYQCNVFIDLISKIAEVYINLWKLILNTREFEDINKLNEYGNEIKYLKYEIEYKFNQISNMNMKNRKIILLYGNYLKDILNEIDLAKKYLNEEIIKNNYEDSNFMFHSVTLSYKDLNPSSTFQFIVVSFKKDNFCILQKISSNLCSILGYSAEEIIGQHLNIFLPDFLKNEHEKMMINREKENKFIVQKKIFDRLNTHTFYFKTSSKYIIPVSLNIGIIFDEDYTPIIFAKLNTDESQNKYTEVCYILTDFNFSIQYFSSNCIHLLKLKNKNIYGKKDIFKLIKEFYNEFYQKIDKNLNPHLIQKKKKLFLKKNYFENEQLITWLKTETTFRLKISEIKINNKLLGYAFRLESFIVSVESTIYKKLISNANNYEKSKMESTIEKNENISSFVLEKKSDFPEINKNFLPNVDLINYNFKDKEFLFTNQKLYKNFNDNKNASSSYNNNEYLNNLGEELKNFINDEYFKIDKNKSSLNFSQSQSQSISKNSSESFLSKSSKFSNLNSSSISNTSEFDKYELKSSDVKKFNSNEKLIEDNYYKINFDKISFFLYDYSKNASFEIKKFHKISKLEELFKSEEIITNELIEKSQIKFQMKKSTSNSYFKSMKKNPTNISNLFEDIKESNPENDKQVNKQKIIKLKKEEEYLNKKIQKKNINKSIIKFVSVIIIFGICYLTLYILIIYYFFNIANNLKNNLLKSFEFLNLMDNSYNILFFSYVLVTIQNEKILKPQETKKKMLQTYRENLLNIYYMIVQMQIQINKNAFPLSKNNQKKFNSYNVGFYSISDNLTYNYSKAYITNILDEFSFALYNLATANESELNLKNIDYNFILYNCEDSFIKTLSNCSYIYFDEYDVDRKYSFMLFIIFIVLLIIIIGSFIYFLNIVNLITIREKEKNLKYFFKIGEEPIRVLLLKCEKYINLNQENKNDVKYLVTTPIINLSNYDDLSSIESKNKNILKYLKENGEFIQKKNDENKRILLSHKKNDLIYDQSSVTYIIKISILNFIQFALFIFLFFYSLINFKYIKNYMQIYLLLVELKDSFSILFDYMFIYIGYVNQKNISVIIQNKINYLLVNLYKEYEYKIEIDQKINNIMEKYSLPKKSKKMIVSMKESSLCFLAQDYLDNLNLSCAFLASNTTEFGFGAISSYFIENIMYITKKVSYLHQQNIAKNYTYDEINYGTIDYVNITDENHYKNNPMFLINDVKTNQLILLREHVFVQCFLNSLNALKDDIIDKIDNIKIITLIICIILFLFYFCIFIVYFPANLYKKNSEINNNREFLKIIPKNVILDIFKSEDEKLAKNK